MSKGLGVEISGSAMVDFSSGSDFKLIADAELVAEDGSDVNSLVEDCVETEDSEIDVDSEEVGEMLPAVEGSSSLSRIELDNSLDVELSPTGFPLATWLVAIIMIRKTGASNIFMAVMVFVARTKSQT